MKSLVYGDMSRRSVVGSSEHGRSEIVYFRLSVEELERRISRYERKCGARFDTYRFGFSCDSARAFEVAGVMDWENLVEELKTRTPERVKAL